MKIGVFDSGIGGMTVLFELLRRMPGAEFVYLGDTAHVPYGTRSPAQIERLSIDCCRALRAEGIDALVVACNTASSWAIEAIRSEMGEGFPVFGMVEPGADAALKAYFALISDQKKDPGSVPILVLATRATVKSMAYARRLEHHLRLSGAGIESGKVIQQACPLWVPMIEEGWVNHPILHATIREYVGSYLEGSPGVALLACTHYPWIQGEIQDCMPGWSVVNSAHAVADSLAESTVMRQVMESGTVREKTDAKVEWIFTDPNAVPEFVKGYYGFDSFGRR